MEGLVDPAVDSPGDPVEASQQALVVDPLVAMEAPMHNAYIEQFSASVYKIQPYMILSYILLLSIIYG